jgi:hypothetical protein
MPFGVVAATGRQGLRTYSRNGPESPHPIRIETWNTSVYVSCKYASTRTPDGRAVFLNPRGLMRQDSLPLVATGGRTADGRTLVHTVTASPININQRIVKTC